MVLGWGFLLALKPHSPYLGGMQYLGGKARIGATLAGLIQPRGVIWEPFCGGLGVTPHLARTAQVLATDVHQPLVSLYQAVQQGWDPPGGVTEEEYHQAKTLPDTDPLKAFIGFGCAFGGKWFGGYARCTNRGTNFAKTARSVLLRDFAKLQSCVFGQLSFLDVDPPTSEAPTAIYADPPYQGTTGYGGTQEFDHAKFWNYCQQWAAKGVQVFVSEYACPVPSRTLWEKEHKVFLTGGSGVKTNTEKLFQVYPA